MVDGSVVWAVSLVKWSAAIHPQQVERRGADDDIDDRATPWEVFDPLHERFGFTVDAAASALNARLERFWTKTDDALSQDWTPERVWCNPPYSNIEPWVGKAWASVDAGCPLVVMLTPANRTEQGWWQRGIEPHRDRGCGVLSVEFIATRIRFVSAGRDRQAEVVDLFGKRESAAIPANSRPPFGCCLLIWGT